MIKKTSGKTYFIILISICLFSFSEHISFAFTLGSITVQSKFGEKFRAEIEVFNDGETGLEASLGTPEDYRLVEIERSQLIDDIYMEILPDPDFGDKQIIRLTSPKVLFYPSLELLVKASLNGGTILEKYILAVDFKHSLSVSLSSEIPVLSEKTTDKNDLHPVKVAAKSIAGKTKIKDKGLQNDIVPKKLSAKLTTYASASGKVVNDEQINENKPADDSKDITPLAKVEQTEDNSTMSTTTVSTIEKDSDKVEKKYLNLLDYYKVGSKNNTIKTVSDMRELKDQKPKMTYGPVRKGETLYRIAKNLKIKEYTVAQVVVALWEMNKVKFANHNMHGLEQNVYLDYTAIKSILGSISDDEAVSKMLDQKSLWEDAAASSQKPLSMQADTGKPDTGKLHALVPPPVVDLPYRKDIYQAILRWKEKWEKNEIDSLMEQYSKTFKNEKTDWHGWMNRKKDFNSRHGNISISIENIEMLRITNDDENIVYTSFLQTFRSSNLKSKGLKSLKFRKEGDQWMIVEELFNTTIKTGKGSPYVIHVASLDNLNGAIAEVNRWRKLGFVAYYALYDIPEKGSWYRIFIDRFSYRNIAWNFAEDLKQKGFTNYTLIMNMPYALELGNYETDRDALNSIQNVHVQNAVSPYLFAENDGDKLSFKVLLSAYTAKKQAIELSEKLTKNNIDHKIVIP